MLAKFFIGARHACVLAAVLVVFASPARAEQPAGDVPPGAIGGVAEEPADRINWMSGPATAALGSEAELTLLETEVFAGAEDTRKLLYALGNRSNGNELGTVAPKDEEQSWLVIFKYFPVGYVSDSEKDDIDADALFKSIKEATDEANAERASRGIPSLHVTGWEEKPKYDATTHNLSWALRAKSDSGEEVINYNVRVLGREGFMSVTLADSPEGYAASKPVVEQLLKRYSFKSGKTYAEWKPGDRVAEYGLTALVAAGAGAAAVKVGLFAALWKFLAKGWKIVAIGAIALVSGVKKLFGGRGSSTDA